jgi:transposase InsO family protein
VRPDGSAPHAYGRFEAQAFGELWTGDGLHGPMLEDRTAILFAFIDDWWRWGHAQDTVRLEATLRRGLESVGLPNACFVDNGSLFISALLHRTLATPGIRIIHSRAGHAPGRGKIERFFQTTVVRPGTANLAMWMSSTSTTETSVGILSPSRSAAARASRATWPVAQNTAVGGEGNSSKARRAASPASGDCRAARW